MAKLANLIERILILDPGAIVSIKDDEYDTLEWHPDNINPTPPTFTQCAAVTSNQLDGLKSNRLKDELLAKAQEMDAIDKLILRGMYKDLQSRGVVSNLQEFWEYLST